MKLHIITIGEPKLHYAKQGWDEYLKRLGRFHQVRVTHLANKHAADTSSILAAAGNSYRIVLEVTGKQFDSHQLADLLEQRSIEGREVSYIVGGPDGLPKEVLDKADLLWSMSQLTFPHDLAMLLLAEALYRASTINAGHPYHRG